jgi:hypothetical protein
MACGQTTAYVKPWWWREGESKTPTLTRLISRGYFVLYLILYVKQRKQSVRVKIMEWLD